MPERINVAVVGAGRRAAQYFRYVPDDLRALVRLAAIADPNEPNREAFQRLFAPRRRIRQYSDADEMLANENPDAVIIASPNKYHAHHTQLAITAGAHVLLEKPVATSVAECRQVWQAARARRAGGRETSVMVGFVLRYTAFYSRIQEIVASGELGTILAIDADENLGTGLTGLFHKSWRRRSDLSGGFLLEKCCHDFDILNWLVGSVPYRAFAIGKRTHFVPSNTGDRQARFDPEVISQIDVADFGDREINAAFPVPLEGSPYDSPSDSPDHTAVLLDFASGALCTFVACMGQPRTTRRIRIFGTNGDLEGNIDDSRIVIHKPHARDNGCDVKDIPIAAEKHNHHGGDGVLAHAFWRTAANQAEPSRAGLREGIDAALVALAAQQSAAAGQSVNIAELRSQVFDFRERI
ncbi:MAG TPA: Gfo/Idh/MocA family oxidoreductase [Streptosporangiaceae bacterium]|nr:Gfo/Idh/MocA family oxidoreductase [Streptosporangiaceae bacterium]